MLSTSPPLFSLMESDFSRRCPCSWICQETSLRSEFPSNRSCYFSQRDHLTIDLIL
jgi:hypothetical protein